ncbi:C40 family peptidase [Streptomyces lavendulocolor]|uniref:C40 family peptidase n=1 Tax=Streptomyces lavendulocolor TaxID=67316 RepID=UPI0033E12948
MNRIRCVTATAITLVCVLNVLGTPVQSFGAPGPLPDGSAGRNLPKKSLEQVRLELQSLYRQAGAATDAYNLAEEQTMKQSAENAKAEQAIVRGTGRINDLKNRAGAAARAQYRLGGLPPEAQLMLTGDPQLFLDGAVRLSEAHKATKDILENLAAKQQEMAAYAKDASTRWRTLEAHRLRQAAAKRRIEARIAAARKLEDRLEEEELVRLRLLEQQGQRRAQSAWLRSGVRNGIEGAASHAGKKAVDFATAQIGKPYVWGAEGPKSYDCSGLTSQAWRTAGRSIPRTSQEQWRLLPRIEIKDLRSGDLIIYHADASHVGMYIGNGTMVHAPRPGRSVTVAGAGSMKILGVVRPG